MKIVKILVLLIIASACKNSGTDKISSQKTITVSVLPQKYFVEKIVGNHFNVNVMVPPGASPERYEPTPMQMKDLSKSFVYFRIGHIEFEKSWMNKLMDINKNMQIVDLSINAKLIEPVYDQSGEHNHDGHHHHGVDPHIWTSPKEVKKQAELIYQFMLKESPDLKDELGKNYINFIQELDSLDQYLVQVLSSYKNRKFLVFHPAFSYLARDYGIEQISIEIDGKEPTPANIQQIIDIAKKEQIKIVFIQKQFSTHNAEVIAKEIDGRVVQIDPLDVNWTESIKYIAEQIAKSYTNSN